MTDTANAGATNRPLLEMRDIGKRFGAITALDRVSPRLYAGEVLGVVGDSGAGKSTLIKALSGLYTASDGELVCDTAVRWCRARRRTRSVSASGWSAGTSRSPAICRSTRTSIWGANRVREHAALRSSTMRSPGAWPWNTSAGCRSTSSRSTSGRCCRRWRTSPVRRGRRRSWSGRWSASCAGRSTVSGRRRCGCRARSSKAQATTENILTANPDLKAIFSSNDNMALGAVAAVRNAGRLDDLFIVGFDDNPNAAAANLAGDPEASVAQRPYVMGQRASKRCSSSRTARRWPTRSTPARSA